VDIKDIGFIESFEVRLRKREIWVKEIDEIFDVVDDGEVIMKGKVASRVGIGKGRR